MGHIIISLEGGIRNLGIVVEGRVGLTVPHTAGFQGLQALPGAHRDLDPYWAVEGSAGGEERDGGA